MLKRVWFPSGGVTTAVDEDGEYAWSPFTLRIEYLELSRGRLRVKAAISLRDSAMARLVGKYKLGAYEIYRDKVADRRAEEKIGKIAPPEKPEAGVLTDQQLLRMVGQVWAWWLRRRVLKLTVSQLTKGVEVKGSYDELRGFVRALVSSTDELAGRIADASAFNRGEVRIYAPGKPQRKKEAKSSAPSLTWI